MDISEGSVIAICGYCGTKQTIPSADNEKKMMMFDRANKLRYQCDFDKAAGMYESIITDFPYEAEAYWGLILCKYGIEYVDDPATGKKIPTCHRSSFDSVMEDDSFEKVMDYADTIAVSIYREEAKAIEKLRRDILEVSSKEDPYDVFICYKETDEFGDRTIDSVIAQDIYKELTNEGYRVFFSRISLEDKLGTAYEPYIFAALNSAKVMLAVGTSYDYYNAVWVKNEWSRFLQLIAKGEKKTLIPCYKDIDAYDMPKEFRHLQAQDMGKVGALSDLVRGINKIIDKDRKKGEITVPLKRETEGIQPLIKRVSIFLEDSDWHNAEIYSDRILDIDPENAYGYYGKLMAQFQVNNTEDLYEVGLSLETNNNVKRILRYGDEEMKNHIRDAINKAKAIERAEEKRKTEIINDAILYVDSDSFGKSIRNYAGLIDIIPWGESKEVSEKVDNYIRNKIKSIYNNNEVEQLEKIKELMLAFQNQVYQPFVDLIDEYLAYFDDETFVERRCPNCGESLSFSLAALKSYESIDCPYCMMKVELN